jgi:O-antigen/teichoic acid export membrane protein
VRTRLLRRSIAAVGIYSSVALGFLGSVVAARVLGSEDFGLFSTIIVATSFCQSLLDLTVEEALVKYGFRYSTREEWGKLRRLYRVGLTVKVGGALLGTLALLLFAPFADDLFDTNGLQTPMLVAATLPLLQSLEGLGGAALFLRGRYDVRSVLLTVSMALRLAGIAIGAQYGLTETIAGIAIAQAISTAIVATVGAAGFRRFPRAPSERIPERREIVSFVLQSSAATGVLSLRGALAPLILGVVTNTTQLGYFRVAQAPQQAFNALSAPVRMVLLTEQTRDWERGRQSQVLRGIRQYTVLAAALMAILVPLLLWLMPDLVRIVYGSEFLPATDAARVFVLAAALVFAVGWTKSFPVTIGRPNLRIYTHGLETIIVLPLTAVLGSMYGATGAALAVLSGTAAFAASWLFIFARVRPDDTPPDRGDELAAAEVEEIEAAAL